MTDLPAPGAVIEPASHALPHLIAAGRLLRAAIKDRVDSYADDEILAAALDLHESAERMVSA